MLVQSGLDLNITFRVLDPDGQAPCSEFTGFEKGSLTDYDSVMQFGAGCDVLTIEIENVNTKALHELRKAGKKVYPQPEVIELIQDKRTQKEYYRQSGIPTARFVLTESREHTRVHEDFLPAVHKLGREGYDGRGVQIIRTVPDLAKAFDSPSVLEELVDFDREISVIVARDERGRVVAYPPVEMMFHPEANLVEFLFAPAQLSQSVAGEAERIARTLISSLNMVGLLAVEMFVTRDGRVLVNECAPRPHNSGHHTLEANGTSQYEQHLRCILGLPAGDPGLLFPSAMINLLGEPGHSGPARYSGLEEVMCIPGVHVHLYGKKLTRPFRKMGHVTVLDSDRDRLMATAQKVKSTLKVTT
jgi:5-(carboxyamino)imidazole ribonucleotide synthase